MQTLGSVLDKKGGVSTGFDFLRVFLASSIVFVHAFGLSQGKDGSLSHNLAVLSIVPMFFALSGFLITSSAMRLRLRDFILNRSFRIVPALAVDILIGAILIGGAFTTLSWSDYYSSAGFWAYLLNLLGLIHFHLPGVFEENPYSNIVNGNLWTIPFEIGCYVLISLLIWLRVLYRRQIVLCVLLGMVALIALSYEAPFNWMALLGVPAMVAEAVDKVLMNYFWVQWRPLYVHFIMGCLFYLYRDKIPYSWSLFCLALVAFALGIMTLPEIGWQMHLYYAPVIVYIMAFVGVSEIPKLPLFRRGDYSYGIYLYGFPVQQGLAASVAPNTMPIWMFLPLSFICVIGIAMLSWHYVEKPVLRLRKNFSFTARKGDEQG